MDGKLRNMTSIYLYDNDNRLLLLYRVKSRVINDCYIGTAGGHFEKDELNDAKTCILRELNEETGLTSNDISEPELRYITLRNKSGEVRIIYYFFAKLLNNDKELKSNEGRLEWFDFEDIKNLNMTHTAKYVILHYIEEGHKNNTLYGGIAVQDGIKFSELKEF